MPSQAAVPSSMKPSKFAKFAPQRARTGSRAREGSEAMPRRMESHVPGVAGEILHFQRRIAEEAKRR